MVSSLRKYFGLDKGTRDSAAHPPCIERYTLIELDMSTSPVVATVLENMPKVSTVDFFGLLVNAGLLPGAVELALILIAELKLLPECSSMGVNQTCYIPLYELVVVGPTTWHFLCQVVVNVLLE